MAEYDLTTAHATYTINGAIVKQDNFDGSTGTGVFASFVRIQKSGTVPGTEQGYNTSYRPLQYDENSSPSFTHDLRLDAVPMIMVDGVAYRELRLDINQVSGGTSALLSLDSLRVFIGGSSGVHGVNPTAADFGIGATLVYDMDGDGNTRLKLNYDLAPGSGNGDVAVLIPNSAFGTAGTTCQYDGGTGTDCSTWLYLYSFFGKTYAANDGFEEWSVRKVPYVSVTKTAVTTFKRAYDWTIDKSVTPDTLSLFRGDSGDVRWTVAVTKDGFTDSDWAVSGTITVDNTSGTEAIIASVTDSISGVAGPVAVVCGVTFPYTLAKNRSLSCTYSASLPDSVSRTNIATATLVDDGAYMGTQAVTFGTPSEFVNDSITVHDTNGHDWTFDSTGTQSYTERFTCNADSGSHRNIAIIGETALADTAYAVVKCYDLTVAKTVNTALSRLYTWNVTKTRATDEPADSITLQTGEIYAFHYQVVVDTTGHLDSGWMASGTITITNPAPMAATLTAVTDSISGLLSGADVTCSELTVPAGGTLECTYTDSLPNADARVNGATATLQNHNYTYAGVGTATGTTSYSDTAAVSFAAATITEIDECVDATDSVHGALGTVCLSDVPKTYTYYENIGPYDVCGRYEVPNTATIVTNDNAVTDTSSHTTIVGVPCLSCNLTQGYWKTHNDSFKGGAPTDSGWFDLLGALGEQTPFYGSNNTGATWFQVFWTPPRGNAYYNLAHQFMAAKLNLAGQAPPASIATAYNGADTFFSTYSPTNWPTARRNELRSWASTLDMFNNTNHCSEDLLTAR